MTLPALYFSGMFDLIKRFLNSMNISYVPMVAQIISSLFHPLFCYIFTVVVDMDIIGIAIAYNITQFTLLVFVICYSICVP